eukprot:TRINITY_DN1126_c0_g2_i3.p2 TRINITY_DN1126_c0_g2~~TRINITY_DN1126_c0_g2_i3.p2  ORF type:complete len:132 (-),score=11.68 TRINITY_DN1126_c0_g2_i3:316-711(-)
MMAEAGGSKQAPKEKNVGKRKSKKSLKAKSPSMHGQKSFTFLENKDLVDQVLTTRRLAHNASLSCSPFLTTSQGLANPARERKAAGKALGNLCKQIGKQSANASTHSKTGRVLSRRQGISTDMQTRRRSTK